MIENIVRQARRRYIVNEGLQQTSFAAAVAAAGLVLLLIAGTRFLEWWTLLVFAAVGIGIGVWRLMKAAPSEYAAAVHLDEHARLHDALSTAVHFAKNPNPLFATFAPAQRQQAEEAAGTVDLSTAVPFTMPRALYAMAALALAASGLVFLRYQMTHTLDLRAPITEVLFEDQAAKAAAKKAGKNDPTAKERLEAAESLLSRDEKSPQQQEQDLEAMLDKALEAPQGNPPEGEKGGSPQDGKSMDGGDNKKDGDPMEGSEEQKGDKNGNDGKSGESKNGKENNSLMDKLKEALSNMASKKDGNNGDKQQGQQQGKNDKGTGEKSSSQKGQKQDGQSQSGQENAENDGDAQKGEQTQGQASDKAGDQKPQAGSGQGSQDGAKDIKAAEQLKAMGKLSEILGKRAQQVSGETSIEVESGAQSLRTQYKDQTASHAAAESEVTRDEIPLDRQSFVQQYFQQVHKPVPPKTTPAKPAAPKQ